MLGSVPRSAQTLVIQIGHFAVPPGLSSRMPSEKTVDTPTLVTNSQRKYPPVGTAGFCSFFEKRWVLVLMLVVELYIRYFL